MIEEVTGDLFVSHLPALAHGCNCRGVMGAGIARQFAEFWPSMYFEYRRRCDHGEFGLGSVMTYRTASGLVVFNLGTQLDPGPTASLDAVGESVSSMVRQAKDMSLPAIGMPRIGCGIGGLDWRDVRSMLQLCAVPQVRLVVYTLPPRPPELVLQRLDNCFCSCGRCGPADAHDCDKPACRR